MPITKMNLLLSSLPLIPFSITIFLFLYPEKSEERKGQVKEKDPGKTGQTLNGLMLGEISIDSKNIMAPKWKTSNSNLNLKLNGF